MGYFLTLSVSSYIIRTAFLVGNRANSSEIRVNNNILKTLQVFSFEPNSRSQFPVQTHATSESFFRNNNKLLKYHTQSLIPPKSPNPCFHNTCLSIRYFHKSDFSLLWLSTCVIKISVSRLFQSLYQPSAPRCLKFHF